jgi:hypothetical protein
MAIRVEPGESPEESVLALVRANLPRLLREHPELRHEVAGILAEAFPTRAEFGEMLAEIRALREEFARRFEVVEGQIRALREDFQGFVEQATRRFEVVEGEIRALREDFQRFAEETARRFEAVDWRFEGVIKEMRGIRLELSALSGRLGHGLEHIVKGVIEEFSGETFTSVERLVLTDTSGELYGVPGAHVEFDLLLSNGTAYVVEVKSHIKQADVLAFHRKADFASRQLGRPLKKFMIAASMEERIESLLRRLEIDFIVRTRIA